MFSVQTHLNHCGLYCTGKLWHKYSYVTWLYVKCMYFFTDEWPTELVSIAQFPCALHSYQWITQIKIYCVSLQNILPEMKSLWNNLQPTLGQRNSCRIQIDETASGLAFLSSRMYPRPPHSDRTERIVQEMKFSLQGLQSALVVKPPSYQQQMDDIDRLLPNM